ncbi:MAG: hypothetical protein HZB79_05410 [Deltaproteobacteria bacterium]|nr:hypothetical protein [Deltaproteobacteria bacterium]
MWAFNKVYSNCSKVLFLLLMPLIIIQCTIFKEIPKESLFEQKLGKNLIRNPNADQGTKYWNAFGEATIENCFQENPCFVIRNKGYFSQDIFIPEFTGLYALLIGRVASERINKDGAITGLPYLYGYMLNKEQGNLINAYLQGQNLLGSAKRENEWVTVWGIFKIPPSTGTIRFFLNQSEKKGIPQNGSAAYFDNLGLYIFKKEDEANSIVDSYYKSD